MASANSPNFLPGRQLRPIALESVPGVKSEATCPVSVLVQDDSPHIVSLESSPLALKQKMLPLEVGASTETMLS